MQDDARKPIPDDEIDLNPFGGKIYRFFRHIFLLLRSQLLITCCFIVAGLVAAFAVRVFIPKTYISSFIIRPTDMRDKVYLKVLSDIPALVKKQDRAALAQLLKMDSLRLAPLVNVTITHAAAKNSADSTNTTEIRLESLDPQMILPVQAGILNYLETHPYYTRIRELQKQQIEMSLAQVDKDILQLDSLKKLQLQIYNTQKVQVPAILPVNELVNPAAIYNVSADRLNKKSGLLAQRAFLDRFLLVKSCVVSRLHDWPPRFIILCLFTVPFSLLVCILALHYKSLRRKA